MTFYWRSAPLRVCWTLDSGEDPTVPYTCYCSPLLLFAFLEGLWVDIWDLLWTFWFLISFESSCLFKMSLTNDLSFPSLHFKYFGVTTFELIYLAGIKFLRVNNFASYELCLLVVVFGEISFTGSYGLLLCVSNINLLCESPTSSGLDSLLRSSRMRLSMANFISPSIWLSIISLGFVPTAPPAYFFVVLWS